MIDLASPAGNVYALIAVARRLAPLTRHCDRVITARMMKGDYQEALAVFDEYFSDFVVLENRPIKARSGGARGRLGRLQRLPEGFRAKGGNQ